jgi:hypothetical protein
MESKTIPNNRFGAIPTYNSKRQVVALRQLIAARRHVSREDRLVIVIGKGGSTEMHELKFTILPSQATGNRIPNSCIDARRYRGIQRDRP